MAKDIPTKLPRCETCVHGFVHPRYPVAEVGVRCDWLGGQFSFRPDHYCAKWEPKETNP